MKDVPSSPLPVVLCLNAFSGARVVRRRPIDVGAATVGVFSDDGGLRWAWALDVSPVEQRGRTGWSYRARLKLEVGRAEQVNLSLEFPCTSWSETNFVLVPGAAYNGNRFAVRRRPYPPMLEDPADIGPDVPCIINDIPRLRMEPGASRFHIRSGDASVPAVGILAPGPEEQVWWMTNQECGWGDHGLWIEESEDRARATVGFETPGVRREQQFGLCTLMKPSEDRGATVEAGQTLELTVRVFVARATCVQDLFESLMVLRDGCTPPPTVRHELPFSAAWDIQERKYNAHNFQFERCYAGVGEGHMACWQPGWTGHGMVTQAMLAEGSAQSQTRARQTLDFALDEGLAASGYAYGYYSTTRGFYGDHFAHPEWPWHLNRKSADLLYFAMRQFDLLQRQDPAWKCPDGWARGARRVADAFVKTWRRYGQLGQFVNHDTGDILVGGSTAGSAAPAGLALAAAWFREPLYLAAAEEIAAKFCREDLARGVTTGGPGEILQAADSESVGNLLESLIVLHECTGKPHWLQQARAAAVQLASWMVPYDYHFPPQSTYGKLDMLTTGTIFASTQNKCAVPGLCTLSGDSLLKLFRATGEPVWLQLLRELSHSLGQFLSREDKVIAGMPAGFMSERVQMGDGIDPCGEICACSCWSEVCLMFAWMEVPGVYVQTDTGVISVNDHVAVTEVVHEKEGVAFTLHNPTRFDAIVKVLAETREQSLVPLGQNGGGRMARVPVKAGASVRIRACGREEGERVVVW